MGLDNGICIKRNAYSESIKPLVKAFEKDWAKEYGYSFEVCYWRKCWNIRGAIIDILEMDIDNDVEVGLSEFNIEDIITFLKSLNEDNWGDYGYSIWEFKGEDKFYKIIKQQIKNLKKLLKLMRKYPDLQVYFYDSY